MNQLSEIISACLDPATVVSSQNTLLTYYESPTFLSELLQLIPNQKQDKLMMILSTIKNFLLAKYNHPQNPIPNDQKSILRDNIFNFFYEIKHCQQAINLYC